MLDKIEDFYWKKVYAYVGSVYVLGAEPHWLNKLFFIEFFFSGPGLGLIHVWKNCFKI